MIPPPPHRLQTGAQRLDLKSVTPLRGHGYTVVGSSLLVCPRDDLRETKRYGEVVG